MSKAIRQTHRWLSIVFTLLAAGLFLVQGLGRTPPQWLFFVPLAPLALMTATGLYMFFRPYAARR
jgi:hypothetical protein